VSTMPTTILIEVSLLKYEIKKELEARAYLIIIFGVLVSG